MNYEQLQEFEENQLRPWIRGGYDRVVGQRLLDTLNAYPAEGLRAAIKARGLKRIIENHIYE